MPDMPDIIHKVLSWLDDETPSYLTPQQLSELDRISKIPPDWRSFETENLIQMANRMRGNSQAELLVKCCGLLFEQGLTSPDCLNEAEYDADLAGKIYRGRNNDYCDAITQFVKWRIVCAKGEYFRAYSYAKEGYEKLRQLLKQKNIKNTEKCKERIRVVLSNLFLSPTDLYQCVTEFCGSRLEVSADQMKKNLQMMIDKKSYLDSGKKIIMYGQMKCLEEMSYSSDCKEETGEAIAFSGIVLWRMEDQEEAVKKIKRAMAYFLPDSHEYAVLEWISGIMEIEIIKKDNNTDKMKIGQTLRTLVKSRKEFSRLRGEADMGSNSLLIRVDWYDHHLDAMQHLLSQNPSNYFNI